MITKDQAINAVEFHADECTETVGPRGGVTITQEVWRRNGKTKLWVTRPDEFRLPIKHGLYNYAYITQAEAYQVHTAEDCPLTTVNPTALADQYKAWLSR